MKEREKGYKKRSSCTFWPELCSGVVVLLLLMTCFYLQQSHESLRFLKYLQNNPLIQIE